MGLKVGNSDAVRLSAVIKYWTASITPAKLFRWVNVSVRYMFDFDMNCKTTSTIPIVSAVHCSQWVPREWLPVPPFHQPERKYVEVYGTAVWIWNNPYVLLWWPNISIPSMGWCMRNTYHRFFLDLAHIIMEISSMCSVITIEGKR